MKKIILFLISLFIFSSSSFASHIAVQDKIKDIKKTLSVQKKEEQALLKNLSSIEKEMGSQSDKLRELENKKQEHEKSLKLLEEKRVVLESSHQKQLEALSILVQAEFQHQHQEKLKLLFELQEWSNLARLNEYFRCFYQARTERINEIKDNLSQLQATQQSLIQEKQNIHLLAEQIKQKQNVLENHYIERQHVLSSLHSQLQKQEEHLSQVFKTLKENHSITPAYIDPVQNFSKMKKKLSLPVQSPGTVLSLIPQAKKKNAKKTYIDAKEGTPVVAIFPGKVVFSEWLRGVGLLIILDHGNGYMSLYGNNQTLYKSLGDTVNQGEMIARVGQSGGQAKPGLYFEIRKDGETLDPTPWFKHA